MIKQPITANKIKGIHITFMIICFALTRYGNPTNYVLARQSRKIDLILWDMLVIKINLFSNKNIQIS